MKQAVAPPAAIRSEGPPQPPPDRAGPPTEDCGPFASWLIAEVDRHGQYQYDMADGSSCGPDQALNEQYRQCQRVRNICLPVGALFPVIRSGGRVTVRPAAA